MVCGGPGFPDERRGGDRDKTTKLAALRQRALGARAGLLSTGMGMDCVTIFVGRGREGGGGLRAAYTRRESMWEVHRDSKERPRLARLVIARACHTCEPERENSRATENVPRDGEGVTTEIIAMLKQWSNLYVRAKESVPRVARARRALLACAVMPTNSRCCCTPVH